MINSFLLLYLELVLIYLKLVILVMLVVDMMGEGVFQFCGKGIGILTYFHGGKRKHSIISTDFGHKNSDGDGNIIF